VVSGLPIARIVAKSPLINSLSALENKIRHPKLIDEGVDPSAHVIGSHKVVQYHRKQCFLRIVRRLGCPALPEGTLEGCFIVVCLRPPERGRAPPPATFRR
jgi:hypothetical protein